MVALHVLLWLLGVVGVILATLVILLVLDTIMTLVGIGRGDVSVDVEDADGDVVTIVLPGILARCREQIEPIMAELVTSGSVWMLNYTGLRLNPNAVANKVAELVDEALASGKKVRLLPISIGGQLTPLAYQRCASTTGVKITMIDGVHGVSTILDKSQKLVQLLFRVITPGAFCNLAFGWLVLKVLMQLPERQNIEVPDGEDVERYKDRVIAQAKKNLSGHDFSMWWSQIAYMLNGRVPYVALRHAEVTYASCQLEGDTGSPVRQPLATELYSHDVENINVVVVSSTHAGFAERRPTWRKFFRDHLPA